MFIHIIKIIGVALFVLLKHSPNSVFRELLPPRNCNRFPLSVICKYASFSFIDA